MTALLNAVVAALLSLAATVSATQPAARVAETVGPPAPTDPATTAPPAVSGPCAEWAQMAWDVGWPEDQWPTQSRVMKCESGCSPTAYNPSGASGLMQVLRGHFAAGEDPFDPATNLAAALRVWRAQGWHAWSCYR